MDDAGLACRAPCGGPATGWRSRRPRPGRYSVALARSAGPRPRSWKGGDGQDGAEDLLPEQAVARGWTCRSSMVGFHVPAAGFGQRLRTPPRTAPRRPSTASRRATKPQVALQLDGKELTAPICGGRAVQGIAKLHGLRRGFGQVRRGRRIVDRGFDQKARACDADLARRLRKIARSGGLGGGLLQIGGVGKNDVRATCRPVPDRPASGSSAPNIPAAAARWGQSR